VKDPFPTLEVAATLGCAILLYRAVLLAKHLGGGRGEHGRLPSLRSGLAGDLMVLAVLIGAGLYGAMAGLSAWFVGLSASGAGLVVVTAALRAHDSRGRRAGRDGRRVPADRARRCPECGARELVVAPEGRLPGVDALEVCRSCGWVQGRVPDPMSWVARHD
jgi:hypothetical protein